MASTSIFEQTKELEAHILGILSGFDIGDMPHNQKNIVNSLKHQLVDARLDARDYEYAQTRAEQLQYSKAGRKRLEQLHQNVIKASEFNLFGTVDIAYISAQLEYISSRMD